MSDTQITSVQSRILGTWLRAAWQPPLLVVISLALAAVILPHWLNELTRLGGSPLNEEPIIRIYILATMLLALCFSAALRWPGWDRGMRYTWCALVALFIVLLPIFALDKEWLWREASFIRYPTALGIAGAGLASAILVITRRTAPRPIREMMFWFVMMLGFAFLAADEMFEIHESFGDWMKEQPALKNIDEDWVTMAYGAVALLGLAGYWILLGRHTPAHEHWLLRGYLTAVGVFFASQVCDTFNDEVHDALTRLTREMAEHGHRFPDLWILLYRPRQLFNGVEEVLECLTAVLLSTFTGRMLLASLVAVPSDAHPTATPSSSGPVVMLCRVLVCTGTVLLVAIGWPAATSTAPLVGIPGSVSCALAPENIYRQRDIEVPSGDIVAVDVDSAAVVHYAASGREQARYYTRQMLRDLRGIRRGADGSITLLTEPNDKRSSFPSMSWTVESAADLLPDLQSNQATP